MMPQHGRPADELEAWKQRYYASLDEHERKEERYRDTQDLLCRALIRLILATKGLDHTLDPHLKQLHEAVRSGLEKNGLKERIDGLSDALLQAGEARGSANPLGDWTGLFELLDRLPLPRSQASRLRTLRQRVSENDYEREPVLEELTEIWAITQPSQDREGFIQRLLGQRGPRAEAVSTDSAGEPLRATLLEVLNRITLSDDLREWAHTLRQQLEAGTHAWADIFVGFADLFLAMHSLIAKEKRDFEGFLEQLTQRLQQLDLDLEGVSSEHTVSWQSARQLEAAAQAEVRGIETSVHEAAELDQLKRVIQERIETLRQRMETRRLADEKRAEKTESHICELTKRLHTMEEETRHLRDRMHKARDQALKDPLTGIPNRLAYDERIVQEYARWKRFQGPLSVLLWDIDHFKQINDRFGHKAGDKALSVIANILSRRVRETDFVARYGGEEFVMLLPGTELPAAGEVAEKIRRSVEDSGFHASGHSVTITISCGISDFRSEDSIDGPLERADQALYQAKEAGRNRCISA